MLFVEPVAVELTLPLTQGDVRRRSAIRTHDRGVHAIEDAPLSPKRQWSEGTILSAVFLDVLPG